MKKQIYFLVSLFALIGFSMNVKGQGNTGRSPETGSVHTYSVTSNTGSSYSWAVTEDVPGTGTNLLSAATVVAGSSTTSSITLTWLAPVSGTTYYVHVVETGSTGCTNHKAFAVRPTTLQLEIVALDETTGHAAKAVGVAADNYCAKDVAVVSWDKTVVTAESDAQDFTYNFGKTYLYYRVEAQNYDYATLAWKPTLSLTGTNTTGSALAISWSTTAPSGVGPQSGWTTVSSGTEFTVPANNKYVYIQVEVDNKTNKTSGEEGLSGQTVQANLTGKDNLNNNVSKINGSTATANDNAIAQIKARPNTGVITAP